MVHIEKRYFTLRETAARWGLNMDDLAYMAENGIMRASMRLFGTRIETGVYERDTRDGQPFRLPLEQNWFTGLQDLLTRDAFRIFSDGEASVAHFDAPGDDYVALMEPNDWISVRREQLVIRREERDRVEARYRQAGHTVANGIAFQHEADYRNVRLGSTEMTLGVVQAQVVRVLHAATLTDQPWLDGKRLLSEAGATSMRMSDVFKSKKGWRDLIVSDRRGRYRLRLNPE